MKARAFDHVILVMFENEYRGLVMQNATMKKIASWGVNLTNSFGTYHPSQTNYIASIAGEQCGWSSDGQVWPLFRQKTVVDLLEAAGLEWKAYMEDFPVVPWNPAWASPAYYDAATPPDIAPPVQWPHDNASYWQKHNPFALFLVNQIREGRWQRIVGLDQFFSDVENGNLPEYSWVTPNIWNDGHYLDGTQEAPKDRSLLIEQSARWLESCLFGWLGDPVSGWKLPPRTLVVLTYDESDFEDSDYEGPNRIYTVLLGDMVQPGTSEAEPYNHYSLLRTVEENFSLGTLAKNDAAANWLRFLWRERLTWAPPARIPAATHAGIAAASQDGQLFVVTQDAASRLLCQSWDGRKWTEPQPIGPLASAFALASAGSGLLLVYRASGSQDLFALSHRGKAGWSADPVALGVQSAGCFALTAFPGGGALLVFTGTAGGGSEMPLRSLLIDSPLRAPFTVSSQPLGRSTDGCLALAALGSTVYLVYGAGPKREEASKPPAGSFLLVASFESAAFNTVSSTSVPSVSTVAYQWSPTPSQTPAPRGGLYVVGEVSESERVVDSPPPTRPTPVAARSAVALAELDGCLRLAAHPPGGGPLRSQTFSLSGVLTSALPTSLQPGDGEGTGYGTLMEAGWGPLEDLGPEFRPAESGPLAMTAHQGALYLFFVAAGSQSVEVAVGRI